MYSSTVTQKGQVTIPAEFRHEMGIGSGDTVEFVKTDGKLTIQKKRKSTFLDLYNCLPKSKHHFTLEELKESRGRRLK